MSSSRVVWSARSSMRPIWKKYQVWSRCSVPSVMPVWSWHPSLTQRKKALRRPGSSSTGSSSERRWCITLSCTHISVEISGRSVRAFSRAARMAETMEFGLVASPT